LFVSQESTGSNDGENSINACKCGMWSFLCNFFNPMGLNVQAFDDIHRILIFFNQLIKEMFLRNRMGMRTNGINYTYTRHLIC
jgi:hypothetical protein